jgi:hypothetical protein
MLLKYKRITIELHIIYKFAPATACIEHVFYLQNLHLTVGFEASIMRGTCK